MHWRSEISRIKSEYGYGSYNEARRALERLCGSARAEELLKEQGRAEVRRQEIARRQREELEVQKNLDAQESGKTEAEELWRSSQRPQAILLMTKAVEWFLSKHDGLDSATRWNNITSECQRTLGQWKSQHESGRQQAQELWKVGDAASRTEAIQLMNKAVEWHCADENHGQSHHATYICKQTLGQWKSQHESQLLQAREL